MLLKRNYRVLRSCAVFSVHSWLLLALCAAGRVCADGHVEFDQQMLQSLGVDKKVASTFSEAPRFMAGETSVALYVNGVNRGRAEVKFNDNGQLCVTADFLSQAGLITPDGFDARTDCSLSGAFWPQAEITPAPDQNRLDLVLPQKFLLPENDPAADYWTHGGRAGLINYVAQYMTSYGRGISTDFIQLGSEAGFNLSDWIVRSRQQLSRMNDEARFDSQGIWAQRSWSRIRKVMQLGQINMSNAGRVLGVQFTPEDALLIRDHSPALVEGIADSQSVVEIRQANVLLYSTTVPAGPYSLSHFRMLNTRTDLVVKVTNSEGTEREFVVPASTFLQRNLTAPELAFGLGRTDQQGSGVKPMVAMLEGGYALGELSLISGSLLVSSAYSMLETNFTSQLFRPWTFRQYSTFSHDSEHHTQGIQSGAEVSWTATERLTLGAELRIQSTGYREFYDALQRQPLETPGMSRNQLGLSVGWDARSVGNLSLSAGRSSYWGGSHADYVRAGWTKAFNGVLISASLARNTRPDGSGGENLFYLTLSMPLSKGNISSYINSGAGQDRVGTRWSQRYSQDRGYSLSGERNLRSDQNSISATGDMVTSLSQLSAGVSAGNKRSTTLNARASGAIVAHAGGVTLSPYQVGDTFGIARVGNESGVRLQTPSGPTWTDWRGYAVVPGLKGFKKAVVQIDARSLDKSIDIANSWQQAMAARGSVTRIDFMVVHNRRVLVGLKDLQSNPIARGASVFNEQGEFVTITGERGQTFIPDADGKNHYEVQVSGRTLCRFSLQLPEKAPSGELYETADSVCH